MPPRSASRKGADWIIANDVSGDVMGGASNRVHLVTGDGIESWELLPKDEVARRLADRIADALEPIRIAVLRLPHGDGLPLPGYATEGAAGMDVVAAEALILATRRAPRGGDRLRDGDPARL
jgi:phosphopantothenoylcysteine decarboxylase/phosphopantothenate--cysteine ligase